MILTDRDTRGKNLISRTERDSGCRNLSLSNVQWELEDESAHNTAGYLVGSSAVISVALFSICYYYDSAAAALATKYFLVLSLSHSFYCFLVSAATCVSFSFSLLLTDDSAPKLHINFPKGPD